jgi:hypothetical protein
MKGSIRSLLLSLLILYSGLLQSQEVFRELDRIYGPDPSLFNGKKYTYFMPSGIEGNQFYSSAEFVKGDVMIRWSGDREVRWESGDDFLLNYDIYNQKLLLKFIDESGAEQIIEPSEAWLESFSLGNVHFKYVEVEKSTRIYQVLGAGKFQVYYFWRKTLRLNNSSVSAHYAFSAPAKSRYVSINGSLQPFGANNSFIRLFGPGKKDMIKKYLQEHNINVKKAPDQAVSDLVDFISNLD